MSTVSTLSQLRRLFFALGLAVSLVLMAAGGLALGLGYNTHGQVSAQLVQEHITFPDTGSDSLKALPPADQSAVAQYAGQEVTTGPQAKVFSENYILVHTQKATQGKTYAQMDSKNPARATALTGDTLRGMLLSANAWWTVGTYTIIGGYGLIALGVGMAAMTVVANKRSPKTL